MPTLVADRISGDSPEDVPHSFAEILFGCLYSRRHVQWLEKMVEQKDAKIMVSRIRVVEITRVAPRTLRSWTSMEEAESDSRAYHSGGLASALHSSLFWSHGWIDRAASSLRKGNVDCALV